MEGNMTVEEVRVIVAVAEKKIKDALLEINLRGIKVTGCLFNRYGNKLESVPPGYGWFTPSIELQYKL